MFSQFQVFFQVFCTCLITALIADHAVGEDWLLGENYEFTRSASVGCSKPGCQATHTWIIDQSNYDCINPTMEVSIIETDFDSSSEQVSIFINNDIIASCEPLNNQCTFDNIPCRDNYHHNNGTYFNISQFFNPLFTTVTISVSLVLDDNVNFGACMYEYNNQEYLLFGSVTLSCAFPDSETRPPTSQPTPEPTPQPTPQPTGSPTRWPTGKPIYIRANTRANTKTNILSHLHTSSYICTNSTIS